MMFSISKRLQEIQAVLKAPKNQYNNFGKYAYRSLEDITEAVKPLLAEAGLSLVIRDEIILVGERYYVKATATITGDIEVEGDQERSSISVSAYAREPLSRKGMDESQITGAASSYARKYAMNGLFAIDDTKDADSDAPPKKDAKKPAPKKPAGKKPDTKPVTNEIVEQAFFEFETVYKDSLAKGFHYGKALLYQAVEQKVGHLPDVKTADKTATVKWILDNIGPREILEQDKF